MCFSSKAEYKHIGKVFKERDFDFSVLFYLLDCEL